MNAAERESLRISLLRFLAHRPWAFGLPTNVLWAHVRLEGLPHVSQQDVEAELLYLSDRGLVARVDKRISPESAAWRITADGRDWLAERGIEP